VAQALAEQALWDPPDYTEVKPSRLVCPYESKTKISLVSQGDPIVKSSRVLFDVNKVPVMISSLNGWAFGYGRFLLCGFALKVRQVQIVWMTF